MILYYYIAMFVFSLVLAAAYAFIFHKHIDAALTLVATLIPVVNLSFVMIARASVIEEALVGLKLSYVGGCFLIVGVMFLIFNVCGVELKPWMRVAIIGVSSVVFLTALSIGHSDIFYIGTPVLKTTADGTSYIDQKQYGFMHTIFYVLVGVYYAMTVAVIIYSFFKKKQVPRSILILIALTVTVSMLGFFGGRIIIQNIELLPATCNIGMVFYLIIASRLRMYDPSDAVMDSLVQKGETGFVSLDHKHHYLGSNDTAKKMFPELNGFQIDHSINDYEFAKARLVPIIEAFESDESNDRQMIFRDGIYYLAHINRLTIGRRHRGYQLLITDDTVNQEHIQLIQTYNSQLEEEVAKKTAHVLEMQNSLVLGMATMIEGRDNSTGGHIKRTSVGVRILIDAIKKEGTLSLDETFCRNLIRAAPMHDLGKIAVDDAILRKPGRYTPEEFAIMKTHAAEGARIVHQILDGTDDVEFHHIAENVAHYHHERWDGSGYPCGLKGEEIPLEARIMAVADVYDALVSKRVYKDSMSFEQADRIIMEGMGTQFDPNLKRYYELARPELERYYSEVTI